MTDNTPLHLKENEYYRTAVYLVNDERGNSLPTTKTVIERITPKQEQRSSITNPFVAASGGSSSGLSKHHHVIQRLHHPKCSTS